MSQSFLAKSSFPWGHQADTHWAEPVGGECGPLCQPVQSSPPTLGKLVLKTLSGFC